MLNGNKNLVTKQTIFMWALNTNIPKRKRPVQIAILSLWPGKQGRYFCESGNFEDFEKYTHHHQCRNISIERECFCWTERWKKCASVQMLIFNGHTMVLVIQTKHDIGVFFSSSFDCTSTLSSADDSTCTFDCAALTGIINDDPKTFTMLAESDKWNGSRTRDFFCWFFDMKCSRPWINKIGTEHKR